jgi:hypothetical protein
VNRGLLGYPRAGLTKRSGPLGFPLRLGNGLIHTTPFDPAGGYTGLINWLGTARGTASFSNPYSVLRVVDVDMYSIYDLNRSMYRLVDQASGEGSGDCHSDNVANSWMMIDFGSDYRVKATGIGLLGRASGNNIPTNFRFEASNDNTNWVTLYDSGGVGVTNATWRAVPVAPAVPYRYYRVYNYGVDGSGGNYLIVGDLEIYGEYYDANING